MLNPSIAYHDGELYCDDIPLRSIVESVGTPTYVYSLKRAVANLRRLQDAFSTIDAHIHYSAKANNNHDLLRTLVAAGAGVDCVSGGEIYAALKAGCPPERIVFAGVGKTPEDLRYAVEQRIGWINIENVEECDLLNALGHQHGTTLRISVRLNPAVEASTHKHIATGHGGAKFGLTSDAARALLERQADYPYLKFEGIHVHIGSQLEETSATAAAVYHALDLIAPYPDIRTVDIGGGLPVVYAPGQSVPDAETFARILRPMLEFYHVILEPGRSIVADAGVLLTKVLYVKEQSGHKFVILDAGMTELLRPALYEAHHDIVPLIQPASDARLESVEVVGPVCETTDTLAHARALPPLAPGDHVALLTAGAYGFVMASNYNARPHPAEIVVSDDGSAWRVSRLRQTWADIV